MTAPAAPAEKALQAEAWEPADVLSRRTSPPGIDERLKWTR
jgi:hypothetical protein